MFKKFVLLSIVFILIFSWMSVFFNPVQVEAQSLSKCGGNKCPPEGTGDLKNIRLQIFIPGITKKCSVTGDKLAFNNPEGKGVCYYIESNLPLYIKRIYSFAIGIIAIIAVVMIMIGGLTWIFAAGNPNKIGSARSQILAAVSGLILALCSYAILNLINPDLVKLSLTTPSKIVTIQQGGGFCCLLYTSPSPRDRTRSRMPSSA